MSVLKAIDANAGDTFTYKLVDDAGGRFALNGNSLVVADGGKLDFEQSTSHSVTVRATDQTGRFVVQHIAIAVSDVAAESLKGSAGNDVFCRRRETLTSSMVPSATTSFRAVSGRTSSRGTRGAISSCSTPG